MCGVGEVSINFDFRFASLLSAMCRDLRGLFDCILCFILLLTVQCTLLLQYMAGGGEKRDAIRFPRAAGRDVG